MSDHWITLVPQDPNFVPVSETHEDAVEWFQAIAPDADEIQITVSDGVQFFDCGENFERILCPRCGEEISMEWWQDRMDDDHDGTGFQLAKYPAPCCGASIGLEELHYEWPQAFARFGIAAMNPNVAELSDEQRSEVERLLGTTLRTIYRHL